MFTIKSGNYGIFDPRTVDLLVRSPVLETEVGTPGLLTFEIDNDHPSISHLTKLSDVVTVYEDGGIIFKGRVIRDSRNFDLTKTVEIEGLGACLNDSVIPPFSFPGDFVNDPEYIIAFTTGNVVEYFLRWLLTTHNSQVSQNQQILLGTVTVTDSNNFIGRSNTDYATTWETICEKLPESKLGGYLMFRYESNGIYLDYLADYQTVNTQRVIFGENLMDLISEVDATEMYTQILPIGADGLTIEDQPDGQVSGTIIKSGKILYDLNTVPTYGKITRIEHWDDVTTSLRLRNKAVAKLQAVGMVQSITVRACDLADTDENVERLKVGHYTWLNSAPHGFSVQYPLVRKSMNLADASQTEVEFGETKTTQTDINVKILRKG